MSESIMSQKKRRGKYEKFYIELLPGVDLHMTLEVVLL
jgi:hypothetical protein